VEFVDYLGQTLSFNGTALTTPNTYSSPNVIDITIPSTITAIQFAVTAPGGICLDAVCPIGSGAVTNGFVGFINTSPSGPTWTVDISVLSSGNYLEINDFSVAESSSPTPEVGTLLLIGSGLIAMRYLRRVHLRYFHSPQPA
jgi:hypothetical protein